MAVGSKSTKPTKSAKSGKVGKAAKSRSGKLEVIEGGRRSGQSSGAVSSGKAAKQHAGRAIQSAIKTLRVEHDGLAALQAALQNGLGKAFAKAVAQFAGCRGRVIVTGIGKSGHIGQKIVATFASTGTPAFFVHPSEASHGDLGMITAQDVVLAMSWSGETVELQNIITFSRRFKVPLIAITSREGSALGQAADIVLELPRAKEACPHGLAPTTSTLMQLAIGDCLAIALLQSKGFSAHDFSVFHPGGSLGAQLKFVGELMHKGDQLPIVRENIKMSDALVTMTTASFGCLGIVNDKGKLIGIITDGDLRRHMGSKLLSSKAKDIMTTNPKTIKADLLASAALEILNASRITSLFVVKKGRPVGIVHVHDLLRAGVA